MAAILIFKCTEGTGTGVRDYSPRGRAIFVASNPNRPRPLSSFDTHVRWQPVTQSARSRRSQGKIGDCKQSTLNLTDFSKLPTSTHTKFHPFLFPQHLHIPFSILNELLAFSRSLQTNIIKISGKKFLNREPNNV